MGKQDVVCAGGVEELDWTLSVMFDAMGCDELELQRHRPAVASRAYDKDRDGFVIAGGAARWWRWRSTSTLVARGAKIHGAGRRLRGQLRRLRHGRAVHGRRGSAARSSRCRPSAGGPSTT